MFYAMKLYDNNFTLRDSHEEFDSNYYPTDPV